MAVIDTVKELLDQLLSLVFPDTCVNCKEVLFKNEKIVCTPCLFTLPFTDYDQIPENPIYQKFGSLHTLIFASALLHFRSKGITQHLLHHLKYKNRKDIGVFLGELSAVKLSHYLREFDGIMAVPIHASKLRQRGYNQSQLIASSIAALIQKEDLSHLVIRYKATRSQTGFSRIGRWQNVSDVYEVTYPEKVKDKRILIIDDVITTGATIVHLAELLEKNGAKAIGILTMAAGK